MKPSTPGAAGAFVSFNDNSTAGSAFIGVTDSSRLRFSGNSTTGNATIGGPGEIDFDDSSTAGSAIISSVGFTFFSAASKGGTAQIELGSIPDFNYFGTLDISGHNAPGLTIGSLADDAGGTFDTFVLLGANNLTIGSNNLSTTFSGVIQDSGSLTKIGTGTLNLTGANTYTGNTNVNRGVLQVDGSITSNTFVNHGAPSQVQGLSMAMS